MAYITTVLGHLKRLYDRALFALQALWLRYRNLRPRSQALIAVAAIILVIIFFSLIRSGSDDASGDTLRSVSLETVGALSGEGGGSSTLFGSVRSITEADVLAKSSGTVEAVYARVGQEVGAGSILAAMENDSEAAAVLSAEGSYEAALAARDIALLESVNTEDSLEGTENSARLAYQSAFTSVENALENYVDPLLAGSQRISGTDLDLQEDRAKLQERIRLWRGKLDDVSGRDPLPLIQEAESIVREASAFVTSFATLVNRPDSGASASARAGIASARTSIEGTLSALISARESVNAARTAAQIAENRTESTSSATASADASVKQALGALRSAQAAFERTVVRAPIAGTVNFLPVRVGDYVSATTHVATVARNGALEIVAFVSEEDSKALMVGEKVLIDGATGGTITFISPALDPVTKQIEVRVGADAGDALLSGQSVRVTLADAREMPAHAPAGPVMLPLSAVKLSAGSRVVFSVGEDMRLVAHEVTVGDVRGDRIEITSELPLDLRIVKDARGLGNGEEVKISTGS